MVSDPIFLGSVGKLPGSAIDNLRRAEQLGLIENAESWVEMRLLRNRLVHEYVDNIAQLSEQLLLAREQAEALHDSYLRLCGG